MFNFAPDLIYCTDGSFRDNLTVYSIIREVTSNQFEIVRKSRLPDQTGVFIAEISAIKVAINYAVELDRRSLILTDSLSAIALSLKEKFKWYI